MKAFIALDIETADSANTAPCEIGIAFVEDGVIKWEKSFLINPETTFNPIAMRIHKITPEIVKDSLNFKETWSEISNYLSYPVVLHNASFDLSVLRKASARYGIEFPKIEYYCTYETAKQNFELKGYKLKDLCSHFNIINDKPHSAKYDAAACAEVAIKMLQAGCSLISTQQADSLVEYNLDEFELKCLQKIKEVLSGYDIRYSKPKNLNIHVCLPSFMSIAKMTKGYYIPTSRDTSKYSDTLLCDSVKAHNRIFIKEPDDILKVSDLIIDKCKASKNSWDDYTSKVTDKTVKKRIKEYTQSTCEIK